MTVNLALTQQWLQLTCTHCECGAELYTFSCSISGCHCHCVFSLSTLLPSPHLPLTPHICSTIQTQCEGAGGWGGGHEAGAGQGRRAALHIPQQKHFFLPASPQEHRLWWRLLCSTPCIFPLQTHLLSGGCLTPLICCSKPCSLQTHSPPPHLGISVQAVNLGVPRAAHYFATRSCQTSRMSPSTTAWPKAAALSSMGSSLHFPEPRVSPCPTAAPIPHH